MLWIGYRGFYLIHYVPFEFYGIDEFLDIIDFVRYSEYFYFVTTLESKVQYFF